MPAFEDMLTGFSVLLAVCGLLMRVVLELQRYDLIVDGLSLAMFLVAIWLYQVKLRREIAALGTKVSELKSGFDREPLYGTVRPVIAALKTAADDYMFAAVGSALENTAKNYLDPHASHMKVAFENREREARLEDDAPVGKFLENLVKNLPPGSVYFGLSFLTSQHGWKGDNKPTHWTSVLHSSYPKVTTCRVWCVRDEREMDRVKVLMRRQRDEYNVVVRYLSPELYDDLKSDIDDISLIWIPSTPGSRVVQWDDLRCSKDPVGELKRAGYKPLSSLRFEILPGGAYIDSVSIEPTNVTEQRNENYRRVWSRALSLPDEKGLAPVT